MFKANDFQPVDETITNTDTSCQSGSESNGNKEVSIHSLEQNPPHQMQFNIIPRTLRY